MARTVKLHELKELAHKTTQNEILLDTHDRIELHIIAQENRTLIKLPFGNKFDVVDGAIIIHDK